jgi:hypothetical protein
VIRGQDYPETKTQKDTAVRHNMRRGRRPVTLGEIMAINYAHDRRERRQRKAD